MGTKEVIDYVMNSPGNTNPSVLKGMLGDTDSSSGISVFMVEIGPQEDNNAITELKATWQEIRDAVVSGKLVIAYTDATAPSGGEFHERLFITRVVCYPNMTRPYSVSVGDNMFACYTSDERPNTGRE